jgi:hypothetical protein
MKREGANTPPLPPELMVHDVAMIFAKMSAVINKTARWPSMVDWIHV